MVSTAIFQAFLGYYVPFNSYALDDDFRRAFPLNFLKSHINCDQNKINWLLQVIEG